MRVMTTKVGGNNENLLSIPAIVNGKSTLRIITDDCYTA
jgi:hypothetical protein